MTQFAAFQKGLLKILFSLRQSILNTKSQFHDFFFFFSQEGFEKLQSEKETSNLRCQSNLVE